MIGVVIATHCSIGSALVHAAQVVLGKQPALTAVDLAPDSDGDAAWHSLHDAVIGASEGDGVLVLVDMLGGTPSNLAMALLAQGEVDVLTGVNLPMVLRALQRRTDVPGLSALAIDVLHYGRRNVMSAAECLQPATEAGT